MQLTLEVISPNGDLLGSNRRKVVGPEGAQIGRSKESDWVINDQYISRIHARVRYVNGAFYIEGLGRNPLAINDPDQTIPNNEPNLLRNGDRFFLDQYEIKVTMSGGSAAAGLIPDDPFSPGAGAGSAAAPAVPHSWSAGGGSLDLNINDGTAEADSNLDPLAALGGSAPKQPVVAPVNLSQRSVLEDSFSAPTPVAAPPPPAPKPAGGGGSKIPDSWEHSSGFTQMGQQPAAPPPPPPVRRPVPPTAQRTVAAPPVSDPKRSDDSIPDTWDKGRTRIETPGPVTEKLPPIAQFVQDAAETQKTAHLGQKPRIPTPAAPPPVSHTVRRPVEEVPPVAPPPARPPMEPAAAGQGSVDLEELLRAAGVPASQMSPEMARELGQVVRIVVQGLMEVLQSRAEIKSQLRMSMTRMQPTENNPLKFSPNVEAALHTLLVERNRGYLPTVRAFQEALTDIRNHQIAVLSGIRTAYNSMIEQFDPEKIDEEVEKQSKRGGLLNLGGKGGRFRDQYVEQFQSIANDPDESFKRLFGEYFAQAYEEQMDRLKAASRTSGGGL
jgi:type VI secretion system FHA domain protein